VAHQTRRFTVAVLRPLQIILLLSGAAFLFESMWWLLGVCILGVFYLGIVGARLHPLQSVTELAEGPLEGEAARIESKLLSPAAQRSLVGRACTQVGILVGLVAGAVAWLGLGWRWYLALIVALVVMLFVGALLKLAFKVPLPLDKR